MTTAIAVTGTAPRPSAVTNAPAASADPAANNPVGVGIGAPGPVFGEGVTPDPNLMFVWDEALWVGVLYSSSIVVADIDLADALADHSVKIGLVSVMNGGTEQNRRQAVARWKLLLVRWLEENRKSGKFLTPVLVGRSS